MAQTTKWKLVSEAKYFEMLEILPPAVQTADGFMVGEPWDHSPQGEPRFEGFVEKAGKFYVATQPLTIHDFRQAAAEFGAR